MSVSDRLNKLNSLNIKYKEDLDTGNMDRQKLIDMKNEIEFYLDLCESNGIPERSGDITKRGVMIDLNTNLDKINEILAEIDNSELEGGKRRRKSRKNKSKKNKSRKNKSRKRRGTNKKYSKPFLI